jgi:hypothetical protein
MIKILKRPNGFVGIECDKQVVEYTNSDDESIHAYLHQNHPSFQESIQFIWKSAVSSLITNDEQ